MLETKAYKKHLERINKKNHVWKESEIRAYRKLIQGQRHIDDALTAIMQTNDGKERKITKEQTAKGIAYLRNANWTPTGKNRNTELSRCFGARERAIILAFRRFAWVGVSYTQCGGYIHTAPIYRVYAKNGASFDYTAQHWGLPEVIR